MKKNHYTILMVQGHGLDSYPSSFEFVLNDVDYLQSMIDNLQKSTFKAVVGHWLDKMNAEQKIQFFYQVQVILQVELNLSEAEDVKANVFLLERKLQAFDESHKPEGNDSRSEKQVEVYYGKIRDDNENGQVPDDYQGMVDDLAVLKIALSDFMACKDDDVKRKMVNKAFRGLARQFHPDKHKGDAITEKFQEVNAAKERLLKYLEGENADDAEDIVVALKANVYKRLVHLIGIHLGGEVAAVLDQTVNDDNVSLWSSLGKKLKEYKVDKSDMGLWLWLMSSMCSRFENRQWLEHFVELGEHWKICLLIIKLLEAYSIEETLDEYQYSEIYNEVTGGGWVAWNEEMDRRSSIKIALKLYFEICGGHGEHNLLDIAIKDMRSPVLLFSHPQVVNAIVDLQRNEDINLSIIAGVWRGLAIIGQSSDEMAKRCIKDATSYNNKLVLQVLDSLMGTIREQVNKDNCFAIDAIWDAACYEILLGAGNAVTIEAFKEVQSEIQQCRESESLVARVLEGLDGKKRLTQRCESLIGLLKRENEVDLAMSEEPAALQEGIEGDLVEEINDADPLSEASEDNSDCESSMVEAVEFHQVDHDLEEEPAERCEDSEGDEPEAPQAQACDDRPAAHEVSEFSEQAVDIAVQRGIGADEHDSASDYEAKKTDLVNSLLMASSQQVTTFAGIGGESYSFNGQKFIITSGVYQALNATEVETQLSDETGYEMFKQTLMAALKTATAKRTGWALGRSEATREFYQQFQQQQQEVDLEQAIQEYNAFGREQLAEAV